MAMEGILIKEIKWKRRMKGRTGKKEASIYPKGQLFLIASIFVLIGLIMLKNLLGIYSTIEEKGSLESLLFDKELRNLMNEYKNIVATASLKSDVGADYLSNFSSFIRNEMNSKILYSFVFMNSSSKNYSVTIGNFLNDKINVTLSATNATPANSIIGIMNDKTNATREFTSNINGTVQLTLIYEKEGQTFEERIAIRSDHNYVTGFFDLVIAEDESFVRMRDGYNRTW